MRAFGQDKGANDRVVVVYEAYCGTLPGYGLFRWRSARSLASGIKIKNKVHDVLRTITDRITDHCTPNELQRTVPCTYSFWRGRLGRTASRGFYVN